MMKNTPVSNEWNPPIRRWVIEAPNTANEHVRQLYDVTHPAGAGRPARIGQVIHEGSLSDLEAACEAAKRRGRTRCGFCDGPLPCLRD